MLDAGADIDADGAVIAGGTPLFNARAFGQWKAAFRLVERGAHVAPMDAATLGLIGRVREFLTSDPAAEDVSRLLWGACHGGRLDAAVMVLDHGADIDWIPDWELPHPARRCRPRGRERAGHRATPTRSAHGRGNSTTADRPARIRSVLRDGYVLAVGMSWATSQTVPLGVGERSGSLAPRSVHWPVEQGETTLFQVSASAVDVVNPGSASCKPARRQGPPRPAQPGGQLRSPSILTSVLPSRKTMDTSSWWICWRSSTSR